MMSIDDPVALAVMEWLSHQAGGRAQRSAVVALRRDLRLP